MSEDHAAAADRLRQLHDEQQASAIDRIAEAQKKDGATRGPFLPGWRVLDLLTGLEGFVLTRTAATPTPFGAFTVQLDRGDVVIRFPKDLMVRPTPPTL